MAEYLCVRDAAVGGRNGALLLTSALRRHRPLVATSVKTKDDLNLLCRSRWPAPNTKSTCAPG
jgi:hypothetical protein